MLNNYRTRRSADNLHTMLRYNEHFRSMYVYQASVCEVVIMIVVSCIPEGTHTTESRARTEKHVLFSSVVVHTHYTPKRSLVNRRVQSSKQGNKCTRDIPTDTRSQLPTPPDNELGSKPREEAAFIIIFFFQIISCDILHALAIFPSLPFSLLCHIDYCCCMLLPLTAAVIRRTGDDN